MAAQRRSAPPSRSDSYLPKERTWHFTQSLTDCTAGRGNSGVRLLLSGGLGHGARFDIALRRVVGSVTPWRLLPFTSGPHLGS